MIIGGLQKNSLIDYPGMVSCVIFLAGCNFKCPYCQNPDLVRGDLLSPIDIGEIRAFLLRRQSLLDGVVISGGEPTLQADLLSLCQILKELGFSVKLDTNGSHPKVIEMLVDKGVVDYIAMDIKTDPHGYGPFFQKSGHPEDILDSIRIIRASPVSHEFRTTCVKPFVDREIVGHISSLIEGAGLYALQRFNPKTVLRPEFFGGTNRGIDEEEMMILKEIAERSVLNCVVR
jgi:pyruvate formate lyase activating enzyme